MDVRGARGAIKDPSHAKSGDVDRVARAGAAGRAARGAGRARGPAAPLFSPLAAHVTNGDTILRLGITMCTIEPVPTHMNDTQITYEVV